MARPRLDRIALLIGITALVLMLLCVSGNELAHAGDGDDLKTDLVAWWDLEEESGTRYDAHGSNDLTDNNTVSRGTGIVDYGGDFEESNTEYLSSADTADLSMGSSVSPTFACWVKFESFSDAESAIMRKWSSGTNEEYILYYVTGTTNRFRFYWNDGGGYPWPYVNADTAGQASTDAWYYVVAWKDATNVNISINNGSADTTATDNSGNSGSDAFYIGSHGSDSNTSVDGIIDSCAIWKRNLTANERTWLYNEGNGREYSDIGAAPTPTPTATTAPTITPTLTTAPTQGTTYTTTLPSGGIGVITAEADMGDLLITGAVVGVGILALVWVSYQLAGRWTKRL